MNCPRRYMCWQRKRLLLGRAPGEGELQGMQPGGSALAMWLTVSGFMGRGLVSGLSLVKHSDLRVLPADTRLCQNGFQQEGFWEVGRTHGLTFPCLFWPFLNSSGWWYVACHFCLPSQDFLFWDNSGKWLPVCLPRVGVLLSGFPNVMNPPF